jgi:hypothetical protein
MKSYLNNLFNISSGCKLLLLAMALLLACKKEQPSVPSSEWQGSGLEVFVDYEPLAAKNLRLFYFVPANANATSPIFFIFHGAERNALEYRNAIINKATAMNFIVVVPEFSEASFSDVNGYQLGNVYIDGDQPSAATLNEEAIWSFSLIEPLFAYVKNKTKNTNATYLAIGHSGGAQFLHRFLMFKPAAKCERAIVSAAGWYTATDKNIDFPYGLRSSPLESLDLAPLYTKNITVQVGTSDNNPNASSLRRNAQADAQGLHRLARAQYFYNNAAQNASSLSLPFTWQLAIIPGLSHNYVAALGHAADLLFP